MKKQIIILMLVCLLIPIINAEIMTIGTFKQNECINLVQTCSNCTYNNISSVLYPNSTNALNQVSMIKTGTSYSYNFCNTSVIGNYIVNGFGDVDGVITVWAYDFDVTTTGQELDTSKSIIMIAGLILLLIVGLVIFYFGYNIGNVTIKVFSIGLSVLIIIFSIGYALTVLNSTIAGFSGITNIISVIYILGVILLTTGGICIIVWLIYITFNQFAKYRGFRD